MNWSTSFEWSRSARVLCNALMKADALLNYWHGASFTHCQKLGKALCTTSFITSAQSAHIRIPFESRVCIYTCCRDMLFSCLHNRNHTRCGKREARSDCVWMCGRVWCCGWSENNFLQAMAKSQGRNRSLVRTGKASSSLSVLVPQSKNLHAVFSFFPPLFCNLFNLVVTKIYTEFSLTSSGKLGTWKMPM